MTPSPAALPLPPVACLLAVTLALLVAGCGDESTGAAEGPTTPQTSPTTNTTSEGGTTRATGCSKHLAAFVNSLDALRRQLAVGLSYEQYVARVKSLRASYKRIPVQRLTFDCLAIGTPAEKALNKHIDAANSWGECLADATCTTATIEPVLQRKWRIASHFISAAW
jgi:hypothetical protein